ncbi:endonuclease/exonuclease/phosphatase family protein, partial [Candidatus Gracilibacteria bacterium]|nr:endonuclease/exonuclease/phosphatase family protein [Candidatus Gracilibacteria bacterium]
YCNKLVENGESVIITGDFNVCHQEIDIARPKENQNSIGFLPIERAKIGEFLDNGYIDVFRFKNPDLTDKYTWWSYRGGARSRNVGWRLDYFFVSKDLIGKVKNVDHLDQQMGSDHCPIVLEIDL